MASLNLEELAKQPFHVKVGIAVGGGVLLLGLYWYLVYSGITEEREQAQQMTQQLQNENKKLKEQKATWEELLLEKGRLDEKLAKNRLSLPSSSELPAFFISMQKQMAASGAELQKWSVGKELAIESYFKVPISIEMEGSFYQVNNYFYLLSQSDRIITVEDLSLKPAGKDNAGLLHAKFTASTFRQDAPDVMPSGSESK